MRRHFSLQLGLIISLSAVIALPAHAQVLVETGVLSKKTKDLGDMIDKAWKEPKPDGGAQPKVTTVPNAAKKASAAGAKPQILPDVFNPDTEDPMNVLDINADVMTRFAAALRSGETGGFTPRQFFVLKARVRPFCAAIVAGQPPPNSLQLSYMPSEAMAIKPRCAEVYPALSESRSK